jgi:hypothetical protein
MARFRFSITSFFVVVTLFSLGLAALVSQSRLLASAGYTVFLGLLCLSLAGAILRPLPDRAFWLGFALFGWSYWFVEFDEGGSYQSAATRQWSSLSGVLYLGASSGSAPSRPSLITRELIGWIDASMSPNRSVGAKVQAQWRGGSYYPGTITQINGSDYLVQWDDGSAPQWTPTTQLASSSPSLLPAAHSLMGGLFALVGGVVVALVFGGMRKPTSVSESHSPTK